MPNQELYEYLWLWSESSGILDARDRNRTDQVSTQRILAKKNDASRSETRSVCQDLSGDAGNKGVAISKAVPRTQSLSGPQIRGDIPMG